MMELHVSKGSYGLKIMLSHGDIYIAEIIPRHHIAKLPIQASQEMIAVMIQRLEKKVCDHLGLNSILSSPSGFESCIHLVKTKLYKSEQLVGIVEPIKLFPNSYYPDFSVAKSSYAEILKAFPPDSIYIEPPGSLNNILDPGTASMIHDDLLNLSKLSKLWNKIGMMAEKTYPQEDIQAMKELYAKMLYNNPNIISVDSDYEEIYNNTVLNKNPLTGEYLLTEGGENSMGSGDDTIPPEFNALLEKELDKILAAAPKPLRKSQGIPQKDFKSMGHKINWLLDGLKTAKSTGDDKMARKIRRDLRALGWNVSKMGYGGVGPAFVNPTPSEEEEEEDEDA